mgnify:CR=1 FL=1
MNKIIQFFDKSENYAKNLICGLMTVILGFLFVESILHTMHLVCDEKTFEGIFMHHDNIFVNACYFFFIFVALLFIVPYLEKIPLKIQITVLSVVTFALGLFWIMTSQCKPASDSYLIVDAAQKAAENDFSFLKDNYYHNYTYLYGSIAYFEVLVRLFGEGHSTVLYMQLPLIVIIIMDITDHQAVLPVFIIGDCRHDLVFHRFGNEKIHRFQFLFIKHCTLFIHIFICPFTKHRHMLGQHHAGPFYFPSVFNHFHPSF